MNHEKVIFAASAIAFAVGITTPVTPEPVRVVTVYKTPLMQVLCGDKHGREEIARICRARSRSL